MALASLIGTLLPLPWLILDHWCGGLPNHSASSGSEQEGKIQQRLDHTWHLRWVNLRLNVGQIIMIQSLSATLTKTDTASLTQLSCL
jgi:hypothetical protein